MFILIFIIIISIIICSILITNKNPTKPENFININNKEKENFILSKAENNIRTYLNCLKTNNYNPMKNICEPKYFQILKNNEKHNELSSKHILNHDNFQITKQGIIEYNNYEKFEYITVAVTLKGFENNFKNYDYSYNIKHYETYKKYTITYKIPLNISQNHNLLITNINENY